jgi:hypothetical protein
LDGEGEGGGVKLKVAIHLDGTSESTVEIKKTAGGTDGLFTVRPKHKRVKYSLMLSEVALMAVSRAAKQTAASQGIPIPVPRKGKR